MLDLTPSSHNPHCTRDRCFYYCTTGLSRKDYLQMSYLYVPGSSTLSAGNWHLFQYFIWTLKLEINYKKKKLSVFSYLFYSTFASGSKESISLVAIGAATVSGLPCLVQGMRMVESNPLLSPLLSLTNQVPISNKQLLGGQTGAFRHSQAR